PNVSARLSSAAPLVLSNSALVATFYPSNATLSVLDGRTGRRWNQRPAQADVIVTGAHAEGNEIRLELIHLPSGLDLKETLQLEPNRPELTLQLEGNGELAAPLHFPYPFESAPGNRLIIPMNEGISFPVEDKSIEPMQLVAYGGHGICMAFWGV